MSLTALAAAAGAVAVSPAEAKDSSFQEVVGQFAQACGVTAPNVTSDLRKQQCCAIVRQLGTENLGFLQAIALGDANDTRLLALNPELVKVLLDCGQDAVDRLAQLAVTVKPTAGPPVPLYTG